MKTLGHIVVLVLSAVTILAVVIVNLPPSPLRDSALQLAEPFLRASGLDQGWGVFAPPRRVELTDISARVQFSDGTTARWRVPHGGPWLRSYADYRWRKYMENVNSDANGAALWRPLASYALRRVVRPGAKPTGVSLIRGWREILPPTARSGVQYGAKSEYTFFSSDDPALLGDAR